MLLLALILTGPALVGRAALGPDQLLDWDPLHRKAPPPPLPHAMDYSPIALDFPGDLAFAHGLHDGRLDSWNPLVSAGAPLWAEHGGPFFPLKIPFYAAPSRATYNIFLALRLVAGGLGAYLLARRRGLTPTAAIAAGATFELSGSLLAPLAFGNSSAPFMLPWVILGSFAIAEDRSWRAATATGISLGITGNCGHPSLILMVFAAFAAAIIGHMVSSWRQPLIAFSIGVYAFSAVCLGLALAAPSLLPLAELASIGTTYKNLPSGMAARNLTLNYSRQKFWAALLHGDLLSPPLDLSAHFAGAPLLLAAPTAVAVLAGVLGRRVKAALVGIALLGIALTLAPMMAIWMNWLPGLRLILPTYAWPLVALPLTQILGDGIDALAGLRKRWSGVIALALTAVVILGRLATAPSVLQPPSAVLGGPPSPAVQFLRARLATGDARMIGFPLLLGLPWTPMLFDLPDFRNASALTVSRYLEYLQAISPKFSDFSTQVIPVTSSPLLDLAAVRYVVLPAPFCSDEFDAYLLPLLPARPSEDDLNMPIAYEDEFVVVHENRAALPRIRIVHRVDQLPSEDAAREWAQAVGARTEHASELGLADMVVLEPDARNIPAPPGAGERSATESVRLLDNSDPDRLLIEAHLETPGFVVIADTYYPGWNAWVDGVSVQIYPANLLFRAVPVPAGTHTLDLRYEPNSFRYGLGLAVVAMILCLCVLLSAGSARKALPD
jgi:hypothetical protein